MAEGIEVSKKLLLLLEALGSSAVGTPPATPMPAWSSDEVRAARSTAPTAALVIEYKREITGAAKPTQDQSGSITLAGDFVDVTSSGAHALDDFALCRSLAWRDGGPSFENESCYAVPAFRLAELANRRMLRAVLDGALKQNAAKAGELADPYYAEQELAVQDAISDPLTASRTAAGTEWRLGKAVVVRSSGGIAFSAAERQAVGRYLARHVDLHPQVRQALLDSGKLPEHLVIERRDPGGASTETITFSDPRRQSVGYPLPGHLVSTVTTDSHATTITGNGLRQALLAVAGTAKPPKPGLDELIDRIEREATEGKSLEAFLGIMTLTQQYGGELQSDPARMTKMRSIAPMLRPVMASLDVRDFANASTLAGSTQPSPQREASARYLAGASGLDALPFGTFRYVTFANLVRTSGETGGWDRSIFARMPSLADCYWTHIAAYPWASPAYKDLGDFWYTQFDTAKAWQAWDLGRAVDPEWKSGPMQAIADLESRVRQAVPNNF